jgi:hypothetical protein
MSKSILSAIDTEISRLQQVKALLSSAGSAAIKRKPGRPTNTGSVLAPKVEKTKKHRKLSAEARERISQAQIKRWAAVRQPANQEGIGAAVAPPNSRKKAAKATA